MSDPILRIEAKLDKHEDYLREIKEDLSEHMRRTAVAEEHLNLHRDALAKLYEDVKPLKVSAAMWAGAGKVLTVLGALASAAAAVWKLVH